MSLTIKRKNAYAEKQAANDSKIGKIQTDIETQQTISKNLDFAQSLADEANRMRNEEIAKLQAKHDSLKEEINKLEGADFTSEYFAEILGQ